jgi:hypothetical protein
MNCTNKDLIKFIRVSYLSRKEIARNYRDGKLLFDLSSFICYFFNIDNIQLNSLTVQIKFFNLKICEIFLKIFLSDSKA